MIKFSYHSAPPRLLPGAALASYYSPAASRQSAAVPTGGDEYPANRWGGLIGRAQATTQAGIVTVPFVLSEAADVRLQLVDPRGRVIVGVVRKALRPGTQRIALNLNGLGLKVSEYALRLHVTTHNGFSWQYRLRMHG